MAALLAPLDDEWPESFVCSSEQENSKTGVNTKAEDASGQLRRSHPGDNVHSFKSMESHVKDADDDKLLLSACFPNGKQEDCVSPASIITEDTWLGQDQFWNTLTHNYGCVTPLDWKHSRTRSLCTPPLNLESKQTKSDVTTELSGGEQEEEEEEGLREQLDMHSIIVPFFNQEPLFTAEQVMEELEEMMQDSLDLEASLSSLDRPCRPCLHSSGYQEGLGALSVAELNQLLGQTEANVRTFSEELIQELARREELDFEKEVKNNFISVLIDVQNRQKERRESLKRMKKLKNPQSWPERNRQSRFSIEGFTSVIQNGFRQTFGSGCSQTQQYLTTVIPYEKKEGPPSIEDLQILTHILQAMKDDSDKVPSLLTDYILKVLCPT